MKKLKIITLIVVLTNCRSVYAMETSSATRDIINSNMYEGAINSISFITNFVDSYFVMFISFVAWFIISAALARNVVAGAYAAYPKLFDKVNELQQQAIGQVQGKLKFGGILSVVFKIIPDFKAISDFDGDNISPKDYFVKAIPQMCAVVLIGAVIYNGQYRDVVGKVTDLGTTLIDRALANADPVALWDRIMDTQGEGLFSTESATGVDNKNTYDIAKSAYTKILGNYTDISTQLDKSLLSSGLEGFIKSNIINDPNAKLANGTYMGSSEFWKMKYAIQMTSATPTDSSSTALDNKTSQYSRTFVYNLTITTSKEVMLTDNVLTLNSAQHEGEVNYLRFIVRYDYDTAALKKYNTERPMELVLHVSSIIGIVGRDDAIQLSDMSNFKFNDSAILRGKNIEISVSSMNKNNNNIITAAEPTALQVKGKNNVMHKVTEVKSDAGGDPYFTQVGVEGGPQWKSSDDITSIKDIDQSGTLPAESVNDNNSETPK